MKLYSQILVVAVVAAISIQAYASEAWRLISEYGGGELINPFSDDLEEGNNFATTVDVAVPHVLWALKNYERATEWIPMVSEARTLSQIDPNRRLGEKKRFNLYDRRPCNRRRSRIQR